MKVFASRFKVFKCRDEWKKALLMGLYSIFFVLTLSFFCKIIISETDSLPQHYFIQLPYVKPKTQDYTMIYSPWYGGKIVKQIVGVAGDTMRYDKDNVLWVNEKKIGRPKKRTTDGTLLTPIKAQVIPECYVFLYSAHTGSFDSRYQELGLIPISSLQGRLIPLQ